MTTDAAYKILGLKHNANKNMIKKRYRYLMHQVHPDANLSKNPAQKKSDFKYSAQEINEAYSFLCKNDISDFKTFGTKSATYNTKKQHGDTQHKYNSFNNSRKKETAWNAEINSNAYTERNIYHYAEDGDGNVFGAFIIATGKYIWNHNEDFPLFLKSMFDVSKKLIDKAEERKAYPASDNVRLKFQAELTYLLSKQFIHFSAAMNDLLKPISDKDKNIFYVDSMLEINENPPILRVGMNLYPAYLKNHRLFVRNKTGKESGYISFKDDRLYYVIIPLLEQKSAQVKIKISKKQDRLNTKKPHNYKNIDFFIKLLPEADKCFPENINMKIDNLLDAYLNA